MTYLRDITEKRRIEGRLIAVMCDLCDSQSTFERKPVDSIDADQMATKKGYIPTLRLGRHVCQTCAKQIAQQLILRLEVRL